MIGNAILQVAGCLYALLCAVLAFALLADAYGGVGINGRFLPGIILLVLPFAIFSLVLLRQSVKARPNVTSTLTLSTLATLYVLVGPIYGFYNWAAPRNVTGFFTAWETFPPIVWVKSAACVAIGIAIWSRHTMVWWLILCLGLLELCLEAFALPRVISAYPSVRFFWPAMAPQVFKVTLLVTFVVLLVAQLVDARRSDGQTQ